MPNNSMKTIRVCYCRPLAMEILHSPLSILVLLLIRRILPLLASNRTNTAVIGMQPSAAIAGWGAFFRSDEQFRATTQFTLQFIGPLQLEQQQNSRQVFSGQESSGAVMTGNEISASDGQQTAFIACINNRTFSISNIQCARRNQATISVSIHPSSWLESWGSFVWWFLVDREYMSRSCLPGPTSPDSAVACRLTFVCAVADTSHSSAIRLLTNPIVIAFGNKLLGSYFQECTEPHRHAQSPIAAFTLCGQIVLRHALNFISSALWKLELSSISCINNKNSISDIFCILCILCIFIWIFTLSSDISTAQLQSAAWTSMKTSKWKQRTGIYKIYA